MSTFVSWDGWQKSPPLPPLEPATVHVWRRRVAGPVSVTESSTGPSVLNALAGSRERPAPGLDDCLTPEEVARAARFRQPADRARFIGARALLRGLLGHYLGQSAPAVRLHTGPAGKLALEPPAGEAAVPAALRFNVSHAGNWALIALTLDRDIGIDVEADRPLSDLSTLAARFFAPAESAALSRLDPAAQQAAFFRIWTRKEAFVKATGEGIAAGLDRFTVSHEEGAHVALRIDGIADDAVPWTIRSLPMGEGYAAAVAVAGPPCAIVTWHWTD